MGWPGPVSRTEPPQDSLSALGLLDRPLGEHAGEVLLVLRARAEVAARVKPVGGMLRRLFRLGALLQRILDRGRPHRSGPDVGQADAPSAVQLLRRDADDCPIAE